MTFFIRFFSLLSIFWSSVGSPGAFDSFGPLEQVEFLCSEPLSLKYPFENLGHGNFENAVNWADPTNALKGSGWKFRTSGRAALATNGSFSHLGGDGVERSIHLETLTLNQEQMAIVERDKPRAKKLASTPISRALLQANRHFHVFILKPLPPEIPDFISWMRESKHAQTLMGIATLALGLSPKQTIAKIELLHGNPGNDRQTPDLIRRLHSQLADWYDKEIENGQTVYALTQLGETGVSPMGRHIIAPGAYVFANKSYAIALNPALAHATICVTSREVDGKQVFDVHAAQKHLFDFMVHANRLKLMTCEGFLTNTQPAVTKVKGAARRH